MLKRLALIALALIFAACFVLALAIDDPVRRGSRWIGNVWHGRHVADFAYGYMLPGESTPQYLKVVPRGPIQGLLVLPEVVPGGNPTHFEEAVLHGRAAGAGIMTLYARVGSRDSDMLLGDSTLVELDHLVQAVLAEHQIPRSHVIVGGLSLAGTLSVKYAEYCAAGGCRDGFTVAGVFAIDAPLDFERFWRAHEHWLTLDRNPGPAGEARWVLPIMERVFGGPPEEQLANYQAIAPFSRSAAAGGNAQLLADTAVRLYTEPDVNWWIETRFLDYYDMNAVDAAAFVNQLRQLDNVRAELITTSGRGYHWDGTRHPHSWGIMDEADTVSWMDELMKSGAQQRHAADGATRRH